ncbi:MAG: cation:proton antiporter [Planctomycetes bacterium]|nr:cation:proton antiporter [Planctomycetota bacterium]
MDAYGFLLTLAIVLGTAGITTVVCHVVKQPVVLGYLVAGLIVGPHVPIAPVADARVVQTLSELGVILLMFALGLEFRLKRLLLVGPTAGVTAIIQSSIMVWLGFLVGRGFGWTNLESLFAGAIVAISSTTIIAKAFDDQKIGGRLRELVVGILIVEDLIAILLMAVLTSVASGGGASVGEIALSGAKLGAFLVGLVVVGLLVVPRTVRFVKRFDSPETTLVASIGLCFAIALLAHEFGYSVALGAFLAGTLVAESGKGHAIERLIRPVRDMFASIFFVSVGMLIDPRLVAEHWIAVVALTALVIAGKVLSVSVGAFLTGNGVRTSVQSGMSLAQIGEFSFILAGLGRTLGATGEFLYPVAVAVSAATTFTTPWLIRSSGSAANFVDRKLPHAWQTYAALYGSWLEGMKHSPSVRGPDSVLRRFGRWLALDGIVLATLVLVACLWTDDSAAFLGERFGLEPLFARAAFLILVGAAAAPFAIGVVQVSRRLGRELAASVLPKEVAGRADTAAAPRRALVVSLQLALVLLVALPIVALSQPFLPSWVPAAVLVVLLCALGIAFTRSAANLQGHVRAGAQVVMELLSRQSAPTTDGEPSAHGASGRDAPAVGLPELASLLPGMGEPVAVRLEADSSSVESTLAELNLRGRTGATVLAITRGREVMLLPGGHTELHAGDLIALTGTREAVAAATELLEARRDDAPTADAF